METSRQQSSKTDRRAAPSLQKFSGLSELRSQLRSWRRAIGVSILKCSRQVLTNLAALLGYLP